MQALQAVHTYYGINTEEQQQELLKKQGMKVEAETAGLTQKEKERQRLNETGELSPEQALEHGYPISPMGTATQSPLGAVVSPPAARSGSALGDHVASSNLPMVAIRTGSGQVSYAPNYKAAEQAQKYEQGNLGITKTKQEIANATQDEARKGRGEIGEFQDKFNHDDIVKNSQADIGMANRISQLATSGNKIGVNLTEDMIGKLATGINRLSPELVENSQAKDFISRIKNKLSKGSTGFSTPEEINDLNQASNLIGKNAAETLDRYASSYGEQVGSRLNKSGEEIKVKYLLPKGTGFSAVSTGVKILDGKPTLFHKTDKGWFPIKGKE